MKSVFISRNIHENSIFYKKLSPDFKVSGQSLIEFSIIPFEKIPATDWIFFYSKNGVDFFFENIKNQGISFEKSSVKWATIGKSTGEHLQKYHIQADFVGNGQPNNTANDFIKKLLEERKTLQKVLFPRALNSKKSIQKLLKNQIQEIDLAIYKNQEKEQFELRNEDILVFTSPMNANAYFKKYTLRPYQQLIAIGQTTATALQHLNFKNIKIAPEPSEQGLARVVLKQQTPKRLPISAFRL